jgi:Asp/Glu/hydantoin racemase
MKHQIAFLHTSPAAIGPLMQFYSKAAPDLEITNLLDDGLLRFFSAGRAGKVETRLREMLATARNTYDAEAAMITCSSVSTSLVEALRTGARLPLMKIDEPMARRAAEAGSEIGVAVTFPPTETATRRLLTETAAELKRTINVQVEVIAGAYDALLTNDYATHDRLLIEGCERLAARGADAIVLAQVSMARVEDQVRGRVNVPVFSSLSTSLDALRKLLPA